MQGKILPWIQMMEGHSHLDAQAHLASYFLDLSIDGMPAEAVCRGPEETHDHKNIIRKMLQPTGTLSGNSRLVTCCSFE
jgi:hypothetical protein